MIMPFGTYITPKRLIGFAAVFCSADSAGAMLSSSGSASIDPRPRRTVRRGIGFLGMNITHSNSKFQILNSYLRAPRAVAMLNGVLVTIPATIDDQEYSARAAPRVMPRTAGMSW